MHKIRLHSILCLLLVFLMLITSLPAMAAGIGTEVIEQLNDDDRAHDHFTVHAEYGEADSLNQIDAKIIITYNQGTASPGGMNAQNVSISLEASDGLKIVQGSDFYLPEYDLTYGETVTLNITVGYEAPSSASKDTIPEPALTVLVNSSNAGSAVYTCQFDVTAEARAMIMGWNCGSNAPVSIENSVNTMDAMFSGSYYNGRKVYTEPYFDYPNFWTLMEDMASWNTDDNDITYIYLSSHGRGTLIDKYLDWNWFTLKTYEFWEASETFWAYTGFVDGIIYSDSILYDAFFETLCKNLKGRVVILFEACFSGQTVDIAKRINLDGNRFSFFTATTPSSTVIVNEGDGYTPFSHIIYDHAMASEGIVTIGEMFDHVRAAAQKENLDETHHIVPYSYGDRNVSLYCSDPNAWMEDPKLAVKKETLKIVNPLRLYYDYLKEVVVPDIGLANQNELSGIFNDDISFWSDLNPSLSGLLSAVVCDFDRDRKMDMLTASVTPRTYGQMLNTCYSVDLTLYQIQNGKVCQSDQFKNAVNMSGEHWYCYAAGAHIGLFEYDGTVYLYVSSGFILAPPAHYDYGVGNYYLLNIKDGKFIEAGNRPFYFSHDMQYFTQYGELFAGRGEKTVPYKAEYLCEISYSRTDTFNKLNFSGDLTYTYQAGDFTHTAEHINGTLPIQVYDMIRLTAQPYQKSEYELLYEANQQTLQNLIDSCPTPSTISISAYTDEETRLIHSLEFITSGDWVRDDDKKQQIKEAYTAVINSELLSFTAEEIAQLSKFDFDAFWAELSVGDAIQVESGGWSDGYDSYSTLSIWISR